MARPKGTRGKYNRQKNTMTLPPDHWTTLLTIGPSYGKAVELLIDEYKRNTMIDLGNGYRLGKNNPLSFVIEKSGIIATGKKAGEITWKTVGHYTTLIGCCKALLKYSIDINVLNTISQLQEQLYTIEKTVIQSCKAINGNSIRLHIVDNGKQSLIAAIDNALTSAPRGNGKRVVFSEPTHNRGWGICKLEPKDCEDCPGCQRITIDDDNFIITDVDGEWSFYNHGDNMNDAMSESPGELYYTKLWATAYIRDELSTEGEPHVFRFIGNKCTYTVHNSRWALESFKRRVTND